MSVFEFSVQYAIVEVRYMNEQVSLSVLSYIYLYDIVVKCDLIIHVLDEKCL